MNKYKILCLVDAVCLVIFITLFSLLEVYNTFAFPNFHPVISIIIFVFSLISTLSLTTILLSKFISTKRKKESKEKQKKSIAIFIINLVIGIIFSVLAIIFLIIIFQYYFMDSDPSIYLSVKVIAYFFIVSTVPATIAVSNLVMRIIRNKDKRDGRDESEPADLSNISCEWNKDTFFEKIIFKQKTYKNMVNLLIHTKS